jgi:DNA-directed RNA polymerase specialized sigma24 family protein
MTETKRTYTCAERTCKTYTLSTAQGVRSLLRDRHALHALRFNGDTDASAILIDLHSAMNTAGLTERQTEAIAWVYGRDVTQTEAARIMGVTREAVSQFISLACERIAAVYERWNYGQIIVEGIGGGTDDDGDIGI